jgi:hypothetical protein
MSDSSLKLIDPYDGALDRTPMARAEAEAALQAIASAVDASLRAVETARSTLQALRADVLRFYARRGYEALGYVSFSQFAQSELRGSLQLAYQLKDCAEIELSLIESGIDVPVDTPTRWLRELMPLKSDKNALALAYHHAQALAEAEGCPLSRKHFDAAVQYVQKYQAIISAGSEYEPVIALVQAGKVAVDQADEIIDALKKIHPVQRRMLLHLTENAGISDPDLIAPLANTLAKSKSRTKDEILATHAVNGVPLLHATVRDLEQAKSESARIYMEEQEQKRMQKYGVVPVVVTVFKGDAERTRAALERELGSDVFAAYLDEWLSTR